MTTVWMNHWFSTAFNIVNLIKTGNPDYKVICTNENERSPIKFACDEWFIEPTLSGMAYIDFCLEFCREHNIDVFMPRRHLTIVSEHKSLFEEIGTRVMVDDYGIVSILNDKVRAYEEFIRRGIGLVPEYRLVTNVDDFRAAYDELSATYKAVCFKFAKDEGGKSYRRIDDKAKGFETLFKKKTTRMTFDEALDCLAERERFTPMMVMPYLPGEETSIDCLRISGRVIAIPRIKTESRVERICYSDGLIKICSELIESFDIEQPCNIQFKNLDGIPYLLEVNTRMSGGVHMSCAGSGVNIPSLAVNKLLGIESCPEYEKRDCFITQVEIPVVL